MVKRSTLDRTPQSSTYVLLAKICICLCTVATSVAMKCTESVHVEFGVYPLVDVWVLFSPVMVVNCSLSDAWNSGFARTDIAKVLAVSPSKRIVAHPIQYSVEFMGIPVASCALALSSVLTWLGSSHG